MEIITSKKVLYNKFDNNIKYNMGTLPIYVEPEECIDLFYNITQDEIIAKQLAIIIADKTLFKQGKTEEEVRGILELNEWGKDFRKKFKETNSLYSKSIFAKNVNDILMDIRDSIDEKQYMLYYMYKINEKLDEGKKLKEQEKIFLKMSKLIPQILEEDEQEIKNIKVDGKVVYTKKDLEKFVLRYNNEKSEYWKEQQLIDCEILLKDSNGYEKYLDKEQLMQIAKKSEENLIYIAKNSLLSNREIRNIINNKTIKGHTILMLFKEGIISVEQLQKLVQKNNLDWKEIRQKAKEIRIQNIGDIKIENKEDWKLLSYNEKLKIIEKYVNENKTDSVIEEIKELYKIENIAELYKKVYNKEQKATPEDIKTYNILSKMHNALGNQKNDEIIGLLEEQFSDEMLENLYADSLIDFSILADYSGEELIQKLYEEGKIKNEDRDQAIKKYLKNVEKEELERLYKNDKITTPEMIEIYMKERTNLESIKFVDELLNPEGKVQNFLTEKALASMYRKAYQKKATQENINKYKRYKLLFQTCKREKLEEKQKIELDENLLEEIGIIDKNKLMNLYKDNLLTLETILKHGRR